jgi:hypothetical protein
MLIADVIPPTKITDPGLLLVLVSLVIFFGLLIGSIIAVVIAHNPKK